MIEYTIPEINEVKTLKLDDYAIEKDLSLFHVYHNQGIISDAVSVLVKVYVDKIMSEPTVNEEEIISRIIKFKDMSKVIKDIYSQISY